MSLIKHKTVTVSSPAMPVLLGLPALEFKSLHGSEALSQLYKYTIELQTPDNKFISADASANIPYKDLVGKEFSLNIELEGSGFGISIGEGTRPIGGMVTRARYVRTENRRSIYEITLEPWLTLATRTSDFKIFQNKSALEIIREVLNDYPYPVDQRTNYLYPKLGYQVQYGETDHAFICRLMAEWGITYYFEHTSRRGKDELAAHTMILVDDAGAYQKNPSEAYQTVSYYPPGHQIDEEHITSFSSAENLQSGQWVMDDFDFTVPRAKLTQTSTMPRKTGHANMEQYQWPGDYNHTQATQGLEITPTAKHLTRVRMEAAGVAGQTAQGSGNLTGLVTGHTFKLQRHPNAKSNADYLITQTQLDIHEKPQSSTSSDESYAVHCAFETIPANNIFRPQWEKDELGRLIKPRTSGDQTAVVTGPAGQELWTDQYGRVKVQFHWDRYGNHDEHSSCWIRVTTPWSGGQLGQTAIPRIGQEVVVTFENGDPDRPLIIGSVNNQMNMAGWNLPSQASITGIRSRELNQDGGNSPAGRSNHLLLDDTQGKIQAQLKSDHDHSQLSLGHITRIEDYTGRKDARGEGFELRTDGHGAVRAKDGLLITTEARDKAAAHTTDMGETVGRLTQARDQHENLAEAAQEAKAQDDKDQSEVAKALKAQNDEIKGGDGGGQEGKFPELQKPHLVLASPAGIESTTPKTTHLASGEHIAMTSGQHTSISAAGSILGVAQKAIRFFAYELGMKFISFAADIEIKALKKGIHMFAAEEITLRAKKIRMVAEEIDILASKRLFTNGGGSTSEKTATGIINATSGAWVEHALHHNSPKPFNMPNTFENPPTDYSLQYTMKGSNGKPLVDHPYEITNSSGKVVARGLTDAEGKTSRHCALRNTDEYGVHTSHIDDAHLSTQYPKGDDFNNDKFNN